ncbi:hypothetical protein QTQ03_29375 [Micromonospora sp. WMMA1363]|uniref:hypothetical protein n=1 Tax=Micromonospora sp. WMMA1363 TaxID=3053985 RepID=UPI00259CD003|nr:hypothetical protein [Micromonospora sp. WMMA1363]MDM4723491.1 hypothetical protein [Micromonospora sp. WMMA1363]
MVDKPGRWRPGSGDVLRLDERTSVQFSGPRAITLRVIAADNRPTYDGWIWLEGYELDDAGLAVRRHTVFVQLAGLRAPTRPAQPSRR